MNTDDQLWDLRQKRLAVYRDKVKVLRYFLLGRNWFNALKALNFASDIHCGFRKDKITPEFLHQVEIALYITTILPGVTYPEETVIAILLHDTVEDYPEKCSHDDVYRTYGERVGAAVERMDKNGKTPEAFFTQLAMDPIASLGKGADRQHNIRTMPGVFTFDKQRAYIAEVRANYLPMLKQARRNFPEQTHAYENLKHIFQIQLELLDAVHEEQQNASNQLQALADTPKPASVVYYQQNEEFEPR